MVAMRKNLNKKKLSSSCFENDTNCFIPEDSGGGVAEVGRFLENAIINFNSTTTATSQLQNSNEFSTFHLKTNLNFSMMDKNMIINNESSLHNLLNLNYNDSLSVKNLAVIENFDSTSMDYEPLSLNNGDDVDVAPFSEFGNLYRHSYNMTVVYCVLYVLIFIVGLIGNSFVIAVVLRAPRMRTVTNFFIVNLAIADILVIVFCIPATLMGNIFVRKYIFLLYTSYYIIM